MKIMEAGGPAETKVRYDSLSPGDCWSFVLGGYVYMKDDAGHGIQLDSGSSCMGEPGDNMVYLLEDVKLTYRRPTT